MTPTEPVEPPEEKLDPSPLAQFDEQDAIKLSAYWNRQRRQYSGWIVLPHYKRISLWRDTEDFATRIVRMLPKLEFPENLWLAYEWNWRTEKCLTPIANEWVSIFDSIIASINPFPLANPDCSGEIRPDSSRHRNLPWPRVSECWVELVFALMRKAREDQDRRQFERWALLLRHIMKINSDWESRWYFEQTIFQLSQFKEKEALKLIDDWPAQPLSFWEARRSALLAELGEVDRAKVIAERLLNDIRTSMQPYVNDYSLLSQEAWLMLQLFTLDLPGNEERQDHELRWNQLKAYDIDPWFERNTLQSEIQIIRNEVNFARRETIEFDPMSRKVHRSMGSSVGSNLNEAFRYLRLFEEGALPMRVGSLHMASDEGAIAGRLISRSSFFCGLSALVRSDDDDVLYSWFDRVRIATLEPEAVPRLAKLLMDALRGAADAVSRDPEQMFRDGSFLGQNFETFSQLVSRLCFRLPQNEIETLLDFVIDMYRWPSFRKHPYIYGKTTDVLLKRVAYAVRPQGLVQRIAALLALPIANEPGFEVGTPGLVDEPFEQLEWPENFELESNFDRGSWSGPIAHLIDLVRHGDNIARQRAVHRLVFVDEIRGLSNEEKTSFRAALWSRLDERGLPANTNLYLFVLLRFPPPDSTDYSTTLKQYLVNDAQVDAHYFKELTNLTASAVSFKHPERNLFTWSEAEALQLFSKTRDWWVSKKSELQAKRASGVIELTDRDEIPIRDFNTFLGKVILPNIRSAPADKKATVIETVDDVEHSGYSVSQVLPLVLAIAPDRFDDLAQRVRSSINSTDGDHARDALFGLYWWYLYSSSEAIAPPPQDLFLEWVSKIAFRRQPALLTAIIQMSMLLDRLPDVLPSQATDPLVIGLQYLLTDTSLPSDRERIELAGAHTTIAIEERPDYRAESMRLAGSLFRYLSSKSQPLPDVLAKWEDAAKSDTLPEVRYAWNEPR